MFIRLACRIVGKIADYLPNTVSYSKSFAVKVNDLPKKYPMAGKVGGPTRAAVISLACALGETLKPGDELSAILRGVTNKGRDIGDYEIVIRRKK